MSNKIGVDKKYKPQAAPCRWKMSYRAWRRNSVKTAHEVWGSAYYSERHSLRYFPHTKSSLDSKDHLI